MSQATSHAFGVRAWESREMSLIGWLLVALALIGAAWVLVAGGDDPAEDMEELWIP